MNDLEKLMAEYDNELTFKFRSDMPDCLSGLIVNRKIYINANLPFQQALATLAEEIGHYETSATKNIVNYKEIANSKEEVKARRWSYQKLIPIECLTKFENQTVMNYEVAEELELPVDVIEEAFEMYKVKGELL
ncbi:hypothetical protein CL176_02260 [Suicoccus acidiformans]|uniref:IrrE N-terminal-like domain-containing protein n=1 Tax=Suicoccus acidiformans TaxID=2036206 RepID=A0A347WIN5_9LACT|nr:ImmA/IrrE family metallo-endopeptidase [Suicoccus acidiformans]AXY24942.1 hypothetical protein CL176_02260 [Suicoccus acidiformans]